MMPEIILKIIWFVFICFITGFGLLVTMGGLMMMFFLWQGLWGN